MTVPVPPGPELPADNSGWTVPGQLEMFETRRMPDAVRAAALANAVDLYGEVPIGEQVDIAAGQVIKMARTFEAYLTGEEAHGS
jgi:hypothetical protein